jgi:putative intracellular protease/amidase
MATKARILIIVTSHAQLGTTGQKTGFWLEELAVPYMHFARAGAVVDIASPKGGQPPVDPKSQGADSDDVKAFLADPEAQKRLAQTLPLATVKADYDAYFVAGGHGVVWDLPEDTRLQGLLAAAYDGGKVVSAVCHGPAALVGVRLKSGQPLVAGRTVAGFSDEEEIAVGLAGVVPFLLEKKLKELGGKYERGPMWGRFAVTDGRLVTGQNPASSLAVAEQVLAVLTGANAHGKAAS